MKKARHFHTATLLKDGRVLVAGGHENGLQSGPSLREAELYDPATGTWSVTGAMVHPRSQHMAVLLPDGKVLVAGTDSDHSVSMTAELYDPVTGTWSATGSLRSGRAFPYSQMLLLSTGEALVRGAPAELYNPALGTWRIVLGIGQLDELVSLPEGRALLMRTIDRLARIYVPETGAVLTTQPVLQRRAPTSLTPLSNGSVLAVIERETVGRLSPREDRATAQLYDVNTGTWNWGPSLGEAHNNHSAIGLADGRALVAGATYFIDYRTTECASPVEIYDPVVKRWCHAASMEEPRYAPKLTRLHNGQVLATGATGDLCAGISGRNQASAELFTPPVREE